MSTFMDAVEGRLRTIERFAVTRVSPRQLTVTFGGPRQVVLREHRTATEDALVVYTTICEDTHVTARAMLEAADSLGLGAIALVGSFYVARLTLTNVHAPTESLSWAVDHVAELADDLRTRLFACEPSNGVSPFTLHFS